MRNLLRLTNAAQRQQAWCDWEFVAERARAAGRDDLVRQHQPAQFAGAWQIDRAIAAVRAEMGWPPVWQLRAAAESAESVGGQSA